MGGSEGREREDRMRCQDNEQQIHLIPMPQSYDTLLTLAVDL